MIGFDPHFLCELYLKPLALNENPHKPYIHI